MPSILIVGAGPGLGAATAQRFAREGFAVGLIARNPASLATLEAQVGRQGGTVGSYVADVSDRVALAAAVARAASDLGPLDVLQFSPVPAPALLKPVLETTVEDLRAATEFSLLGFATAAAAVLPSMIDRGQGTILLVNGSSAVVPNGAVAGTSAGFAGESAYAAMLHDAAAPHHVQVRQLIIPGAIGGGDPRFDPAALAQRLWLLHTTPGTMRVIVGE
jgi:NADP-dependent 3-hydroxy acid dehydrogenase YdfG